MENKFVNNITIKFMTMSLTKFYFEQILEINFLETVIRAIIHSLLSMATRITSMLLRIFPLEVNYFYIPLSQDDVIVSGERSLV